MSNPGRKPGKRGALPRDPSRPVPFLEHYQRPWEGPLGLPAAQGGLPPASGDVDRASMVTDWPMYLNDQIGDCTAAGAAHMLTAMCVYAGHPVPAFADATIQDAYTAVSGYVPGDPSTDLGADPVAVLEHLRSTGLRDEAGVIHKVSAWAAFRDVRNFPLMTQVLDAFGSVYFAIECPRSAEAQFSRGVPWAWEKGSPSLGGHMLCLQRHRASGTGVWESVTWGDLALLTRSFLWHQVTEAYAVVSADWVEANGDSPRGLDLAQLIADLTDV